MDDAEHGLANGGPGPELKSQSAGLNRERSPLPAPQPQRPPGTMRNPNESLDGETIFAVGEEAERFSDSDDSDGQERKGLTRKDS